MALDIVTFDPLHGGRTLFKALGHPLALAKIERLLDRLAAAGPVGLYDPDASAATLAQMHELRRVHFAAAYVQDWERVGAPLLGLSAEPVTAMAERRDLRTLFLAAFDAERRLAELRPLLPPGMKIATLDEVRIPEELLSRRDHYLDRLNFATNFALFRDGDGLHTRLVTADYWSGYGAEAPELLLILFDGGGRQLADWRQKPSGAGGTIAVDSREVRRRFGLGPFAGQLFLQAIGAAGHDIVKYVLDTLADAPGRVSTTHDANAWPADFYAGLPAPAAGERVVLWLQNAHPAPIPAGAIGLNLMGREETLVTVDEPIPGWGTVQVELGRLLPEARWPQQIELRAGRHLVRPRYEVIGAAGQRRIAHLNVERTDLAPDPRLPDLAPLFGKGFLLPAPILPPARWRTLALPTPMARSQDRLPVAALLSDPEGRQRAHISWGNLARGSVTALDIGEIFERSSVEPTTGYGHVELVYDFAAGGEGDGWLHGLFRYQDRQSGQGADTSFGAHIFNTPLVYGAEPHSYSGPPPGLTTRLYLRLAPAPLESFCHLIYPASTPWRPVSATSLSLADATGQVRAKAELAIPCGGSRLWRPGEVFAAKDLAAAGEDAHVIVRDTTCRLFGYHGIDGPDGAFCLDHMFGF